MPFSRARWVARQTRSEASAEPPGLSIRKMIASISGCLGGSLECLGDGGGREHLPSSRAAGSLASHDRTGPVDQGEAGDRVEADAGRIHLCVLRPLHDRSLLLPIPEPFQDLVEEADPVAEPVFLHLGGSRGRRVDRGVDLLRGEGAPFGDRLDEAIVDRVEKCRRHLPVRIGHLGFREALDGALVLADSLVLDLDADLLEEAAQEQILGGQTDEGIARSGSHVDLVGSGRDEVLEVGTVFLDLEIGDGSPTPLREPGDRRPDLVGLPPADTDRANPEHDCGESLVALRLGELREQTDQWSLRCAEQPGEIGGGVGLHVRPLEIHHQNGPVLDSGSAADHQPCQDQQEQDEADDPASCHGSPPSALGNETSRDRRVS